MNWQAKIADCKASVFGTCLEYVAELLDGEGTQEKWEAWHAIVAQAGLTPDERNLVVVLATQHHRATDGVPAQVASPHGEGR